MMEEPEIDGPYDTWKDKAVYGCIWLFMLAVSVYALRTLFMMMVYRHA